MQMECRDVVQLFKLISGRKKELVKLAME